LRLEPCTAYPRTSGGIGQVDVLLILTAFADPEFEQIGFEVFVAGEQHDGIQLKVKLSVGDQLLVNDAYVVLSTERFTHAPSDPGIDDYRNGLLWSPRIELIDAVIQLWYKDKLIDEVRSHTAMRC